MSESGKIDVGSVLVVEDDPFLRMDAVDIFEEFGVEALEASDTARALALLEKVGAVQALFTDVELPGPCDGMEFARQVRERWPDAVIVITSGNASYASAPRPEGSHFVPKPYRPVDIARAFETARAVPA